MRVPQAPRRAKRERREKPERERSYSGSVISYGRSSPFQSPFITEKKMISNSISAFKSLWTSGIIFNLINERRKKAF
jgi:hypothetical protein